MTVPTILQVEAALSTCSYVDSVMVYADPFHNYCVALIVPSHQALEKWAQEAGVVHTNFSELCDKSEAVSEVQQSLSKVSYMNQFCKIYMTLLSNDFLYHLHIFLKH